MFLKNSKKTTNMLNNHANLALVADESGKITSYQIEAIKRYLKRYLKKKVIILFRAHPNSPITKKPNDIRRGRGKGNLIYHTLCTNMTVKILNSTPVQSSS